MNVIVYRHSKIKNSKEPKDVAKNWMRPRSALEVLGLWKKINNSEFRGKFEPHYPKLEKPIC